MAVVWKVWSGDEELSDSVEFSSPVSCFVEGFAGAICGFLVIRMSQKNRMISQLG
jgi:hypothetical protein